MGSPPQRRCHFHCLATLVMALSRGSFPGSGILRQVRALPGWTASDTLSVSANSYASWPAWPTRLLYVEKDTQGH
jgi:hypothetical protein